MTPNVVFLYADHWTVLMASCTATASEDKIARCVELLLSRNVDPNVADRWGRNLQMCFKDFLRNT